MKVKSKMISNLPWCVVDLFCSFSPPPAPGPLIVGIQLKHKCPKNQPSICRHYLAYNISSAFQIVENGYNLKRGPNNLKPKHFIYLNGCPEMSIWSILCVEKQKIKVTAVDGKYSRTLLYNVFSYDECCAFSCLLVSFEWRFFVDTADTSQDLSAENLAPSLAFTPKLWR